MARRKNDTLKRKEAQRNYRRICWVSPEGCTEKDYFSMDVFRSAGISVQYPENIHPHRRDPKQTLKRFKKAMRTRKFRAEDEAWILVDIDNWDQNDIEDLLKWANEDSRHHAAISNPKFELFRGFGSLCDKGLA